MPPSPLCRSFSLKSSPIGALISAQRQNDGEPETDGEDITKEIHVPERRKINEGLVRNRSINQFSGLLRDMVTAAANDIESITLF